MRQFRNVCLAIVLLFVAVLYAGQIYGSIIFEGKGVSREPIEITCREGTTPTPGVTAEDGTYRVNVSQQGQCTLSLPRYAGRPSAVIFSGPSPSAYNFELVKHPDGSYELRRR